MINNCKLHGLIYACVCVLRESVFMYLNDFFNEKELDVILTELKEVQITMAEQKV